MVRHRCTTKTKDGFVLLVSVLLISAIGVAAMSGVLLMGNGSARRSFTLLQQIQARAAADACAELALNQIWLSPSYTGTSSTQVGVGSCASTVTNTGGNSRTIAASSTVQNIVSRVLVTVTALSPSIVVSSWQEVADF